MRPRENINRPMRSSPDRMPQARRWAWRQPLGLQVVEHPLWCTNFYNLSTVNEYDAIGDLASEGHFVCDTYHRHIRL
jgi:hypothetical protein